MNSRRDDKEERGGDLYEDEASHNNNVACGESGRNSMGSNAPASTSLVYNVFAEYKKTFGMARQKQKAARSAPHNCKDSDIAASSILQSIRLDELRAVTNDGVTSVEQPIEVVGNNTGPAKFSRELENRFTSQLR
jgi:hypothetical protein